MFKEICKKCNYEYDGYEGQVNFNEELMCYNCFNKIEITLPFFYKDIPNYCEGCTRIIFTFNNSEELFLKLSYELSKNVIFVKGYDNKLMIQALSEKFWWVLGYLCNFDCSILTIPDFNPDIYDNFGKPIKEKIENWLLNKMVIEGK